MKDKINSYFAVLLITIAGAGATMIIVRVANTDTSTFATGSEAQYASLQNSILKK
ncbi:MAG: hypothetical protein KGJ31_02395 [Patescibacteria group bacterium]|nr:hypothetical protein [Patescibacteria group bacterium]